MRMRHFALAAVAFIGSLGVALPAPTPGGGAPVAQPTIDFDLSAGMPAGTRTKVLYVLAITNDPTMQGELVSSLMNVMKPFAFVGGAKPIAEPQWTLADYYSACTMYPDSTQGALVSYIAMYAACLRSGTSNPPGATHYIWVSDLARGYKDQKPFLMAPSLFVLGMAGTAYAAFFPAHTQQTTTTHVYPTTAPIPAAGETSQTQNLTSSSTNASGLNSIAGGFVTSYAAAVVSTPAPAQQGTVWDAVEYVAIGIMKDMNCPTLDRHARSGTGDISPICADGPTPQPSPTPQATPTPKPARVAAVSPMATVTFAPPGHGPKGKASAKPGAKPSAKSTAKSQKTVPKVSPGPS